MAKVGVIGAGSWGIALAKLLRTNGNEVTVWSIVEEEVAMLRREHEHIDKLPGVKLPEDVLFTTDLKEAIVGKEFLILAVPSVFTRSTAKSMAGYVPEGQIIVCVRFHVRMLLSCADRPTRKRLESDFRQPLWQEQRQKALQKKSRICL